MKRLVIEIDEDLHKEIRSSAFKSEKSIKRYVTEILQKEIQGETKDCKNEKYR